MNWVGIWDDFTGMEVSEGGDFENMEGWICWIMNGYSYVRSGWVWAWLVHDC